MIPSAVTNAATRTVPIIPSVPAARTAPRPTALTLAPGKPAAPASTPPAPAPPVRPAPVPATAVPAGPPANVSANAYFEWFQACRCGHSSAWHGGAFGDAWRHGQQVQGGCESAAGEGTAQRCGCSHFVAAG